MALTKYDVARFRQAVSKRVGKGRDPMEFRPPKAEPDQKLKFWFHILGPFQEGDTLDGGRKAVRGMGDEFYVTDGAHYLERKRYGCPRVILDEPCKLCQLGFDMLSETDDADERTKILQELIANCYYKVNIWFPNNLKNNPTPEQLQGKVLWFNAPRTVFDLWWEALQRDDDGGDPEQPEPFGCFFDEFSSYLFELAISKRGRGNNYEQSRFRVRPYPRPLVVTPEGKPHLQRIAQILAGRHDLFAKRADVDAEAIERLTADQIEGKGKEQDGGFDYDESVEAVVEAERPVRTASTKTTKTATSVASAKSNQVASDSVESEPVPKVLSEFGPADVEAPFDLEAPTESVAPTEPVESEPLSEETISPASQRSVPVGARQPTQPAKSAKPVTRPASQAKPAPKPAEEPVTADADDAEVDEILRQLGAEA
jgi:hypothetical protein